MCATAIYNEAAEGLGGKKNFKLGFDTHLAYKKSKVKPKENHGIAGFFYSPLTGAHKPNSTHKHASYTGYKN